MGEPESLDEQALMEDDGLEWDIMSGRYVFRDAGFGGQDITYEIGSASGPCITHNDIGHPKCQNHECCIGHNATTCRAIGYDPPEYTPDTEDDYLTEIFAEYERTTDERIQNMDT